MAMIILFNEKPVHNTILKPQNKENLVTNTLLIYTILNYHRFLHFSAFYVGHESIQRILRFI